MNGEGSVRQQDWLNTDKPHGMLLYLRGRGSNRKLRLYACAAARLAHISGVPQAAPL